MKAHWHWSSKYLIEYQPFRDENLCTSLPSELWLKEIQVKYFYMNILTISASVNGNIPTTLLMNFCHEEIIRDTFLHEHLRYVSIYDIISLFLLFPSHYSVHLNLSHKLFCLNDSNYWAACFTPGMSISVPRVCPCQVSTPGGYRFTTVTTG